MSFRYNTTARTSPSTREHNLLTPKGGISLDMVMPYPLIIPK
jgi:hypothetical protein